MLLIKSFIKKQLLIIISLFALYSCISDDNYSIPNIIYEDLQSNITIQDIIEQAKSDASKFDDDKIVEGYVVSSDEGGNIYKNIYIVTEDAKKGVMLKIDDSSLNNYYPLGKKIYVKLKGLYFAKQDDYVQIGLKGGDKYVIENIPLEIAKKQISIAEQTKQDDQLINKFNTIKDLLDNKDDYLSTLVEIKKAEFKDYKNKTYYIETDKGGTNNILEDSLNSKLIVRVSSYANFANQNVDSLSGSIKGIFTKFGKSYQLTVRFKDDINMTQKRFGDAPPPDDNIKANYTIPELKSLAQNKPIEIKDDKIIEGYIVSSDESGNIYQQLYIVTKDGSSGISLKVKGADIYKKFPVGLKIFLKIKGLYLAKSNDIVEIGTKGNDKYPLGLIDPNSIIPSSEKIDENILLKQFPNILEASTDDNLATLVELSGIQFKDYENTKYNSTDKPVDHILVDKDGNTIILRISNYSEFKNDDIPSNSGKIKGLLTKYISKEGTSNYQLIIRDTRDINLTEKRFEYNPSPIDTDSLGTKNNPYTADYIDKKQGESNKWIKAYIVGDINGKNIDESAEFQAPFNSQSNILIASSPDEKDISKCFPVQLPNSNIRKMLNLKDTPTNFRKQVLLCGDLDKYFNKSGIKKIKEYEFLE